MDESINGNSSGERPRKRVTRALSNPGRLRRFIAIAACFAFGINFLLAQVSLDSAREGEASAIQVIQVWTPHIYYAVLITGVAVALYIYSRSHD